MKAVLMRFMKFGLVGFSGVFVNLGVLYVCQEFIFAFIPLAKVRLDFALAVAILCSTITNFTLNRAWTWRDRQESLNKSLLLQFSQYAIACWLGIALQVIFTKLFAIYFYYMIANAMAIVLASLFNFVAIGAWTFRARPAYQN